MCLCEERSDELVVEYKQERRENEILEVVTIHWARWRMLGGEWDRAKYVTVLLSKSLKIKTCPRDFMLYVLLSFCMFHSMYYECDMSW